jgi:hypothetical protein
MQADQVYPQLITLDSNHEIALIDPRKKNRLLFLFLLLPSFVPILMSLLLGAADEIRTPDKLFFGFAFCYLVAAVSCYVWFRGRNQPLVFRGEFIVSSAIHLSQQSVRLADIKKIRIQLYGNIFTVACHGLGILIDPAVVYSGKNLKPSRLIPTLGRIFGIHWLIPDCYKCPAIDLAIKISRISEQITGEPIPIEIQQVDGRTTPYLTDKYAVLPELSCIRCRFDLRGKLLTDRCPECGAAARLSMDGESLNDLPFPLLRKLRIGAYLLANAGLIALVGVFATGELIAELPQLGFFPPEIYQLFVLIFVLASPLLFLGTLFLTVSDPQNPYLPRSRHVARLAVGVSIIASGLILISRPQLVVLLTKLPIIPIIALIPLTWYSRWLAGRIPSHKARCIAEVLLALSATFVLASLLWQIQEIVIMFFAKRVAASAAPPKPPITLPNLRMLTDVLCSLVPIAMVGLFVVIGRALGKIIHSKGSKDLSANEVA